MIKLYDLSFNEESILGETQYEARLLLNMRFVGVKEFIPIIHHDALFFKEPGNYGFKWWHGWLKGIPFVSGYVRGIKYDFVYSREYILINVENPIFNSSYWGKSEIQFHSVSIDIGGEDLVVI
jgi:hypothetical protein